MPSVCALLQRTEARRNRIGAGKACILDLIDNGAQLAIEFRAANALPASERDAALTRIIDPVSEVCEAGARRRDTGLPLNDSWRYFRHVWAHEYRSI